MIDFFIFLFILFLLIIFLGVKRCQRDLEDLKKDLKKLLKEDSKD